MGLALLLAIGFLVFWLALVALTLRALLYPARRTFAWCVSYGQPADPGGLSPPREFRAETLRAADGAELPYWVIRGDAPAGPIVIFSHGWGESRQSVLQRLDALAGECSQVISWDLPGHGEASPGRCTLGTGESHALARLFDLVGEHVPPDRPVILYGFSLGAVVSIRAGAECSDRIAGVIAEAPYRQPWTPARNVMDLKGLPHRLNLRPALFLAGLTLGDGPFWTGFDRAELAARLPFPLLVLHGESDAMCPLADGEAIAAAAPDGRLCPIEEAGHLDLWLAPQWREKAGEAVRAFISEIGARAPARS